MSNANETDDVANRAQLAVSPDEYALNDVFLVTNAVNVSIKLMMIELSYYEDIFRGAITGHVVINDSQSLIDTVPLTGFEYIKLKFKKSNESKTDIDRFFRVYRISDRVRSSNTNESYKINFCSDELFLSEQMKVSRSFVGRKVEDMVYDIMKNDLKIPDKKMVIGRTTGIYDFAVTYKKPFEAINWLAGYARPMNRPGADFVFFESIDGFNFVSLQDLYTRPVYSSFFYGNRPTLNINQSVLAIKGYNFLDTFDTLYATNRGIFSNKLISVDPLTRSYHTTVFDYGEYSVSGSSKRLNDFVINTSLPNRHNKLPTKNYDSVIKVALSTKNQKNAKGISGTPFGDAVGHDIFVEETIPHRTAQLALSNYSRLKLSLSGDPNITVGTTLNLYLPSARLDGRDAHHSGKYLVTSVRQIIDVNLRYETVIEVAKDSYSAGIPTYNENDLFKEAIARNG